MHLEHLHRHLQLTELSRRDALKLAGAGAAAALGSSVLGAGPAGAVEGPATADEARLPASAFTDVMFDVAAVEAGAWAPTVYGRSDQRGSFNEVTPAKTAEALRLLDAKKPVNTYNLGELLFNGFPAFRNLPPRVYEQRLAVFGYDPGPGFDPTDPDDPNRLEDPSHGYVSATEPFGANRLTYNEERFPFSGTYQIATQLDNLPHIGVGTTYYNGVNGPDAAEPWGFNKLGNEHMGPIVTRGMVLDILGLKQAQGARGDYFTTGDGEKVLRDNYRITIEDIEAARKRQGLSDVRPGDVVLFRTGWTHLVDDPDRYLAGEPGIYLREARYLAARRPAIIGGDTWGLEATDPDVTKGNAFPVHQVLIVRHGIRIGEGMRTESLVGDGVFEFVFVITPQYAKGATAGNTPPAALANAKNR